MVGLMVLHLVHMTLFVQTTIKDLHYYRDKNAFHLLSDVCAPRESVPVLSLGFVIVKSRIYLVSSWMLFT